VRALVRAGQTTVDTSMLTRLCEVAVDELGVSGAVVSLMTPVESGRHQTGTIAAASGARARFVEELEFSLGEGPGTDAFVTSRPVLTAALERALDRWPGYVPAAHTAGVRATFAFPMLVGAARFGVLHLHGAQTRTLTSDDIATSLMLTELAMEIVLDVFSPGGGPAPSGTPLLGAPDRRDAIYQAQGKVMVELGISLQEALARMRARAFAADQGLADLAADILAGRARLHQDPDKAP
jgi:GAF domain-containing protein/ANTAR domain-containing protein